MEFNKFFVVYDPTREQQSALERAARIAGESQAELHLYACVVTTEVEWEKDWCQSVVRASIRYAADVVFKSSTPHTTSQRFFNRTSDWTLIRECLCPVLLVKEETDYSSRNVVAAIDARDNDENYAQLNRRIIDFSRRVMDNEYAEVHFINAYRDLASSPDRSALIRNVGVSGDKVRIRMGEPDDVIVDNARELKASLVVVGNAARSGLSALVHGNTVEKVVDRVDCDVLSMP
jgi:universal stress protein E